MGEGQDKVIQCAGEWSDSSETFRGGVSIQVAPLTPAPRPPPPWNLEPGCSQKGWCWRQFGAYDLGLRRDCG